MGAFTERSAFIALNSVPRIGAMKVRALKRAFGSLEEVRNHSAETIAHTCKEIGLPLSQALWEALHSNIAEAEERRAKESNVQILTWHDEAYPEKLRALESALLCLYCTGDVSLLKKDQVAIVGTRRASVYGAEQAKRFAFALAQAGLQITSGLAEGIDTAAHEGALAAEGAHAGKTIAVLGTGLDCVYPASRVPLARDIVRKGGLVVSEFPFGRHGDTRTFPQRNRIIAALSDGVLCVETPARGGTLITTDNALDFGRPVYAIPGRVDWPSFTGNHVLIRNGDARLVLSPNDILETFECLIPEETTAAADPLFGLSENDRIVYQAVTPEGSSLDDLCHATGLPMPAVMASTVSLQMRRKLLPRPGGLVVRAHK